MSSRIISKKERVFDWVNTLFMLIVIVLTLYPFWYVIVASVSSISHVTNSVVLLWPDGLNWDAYQQVFRNNLVPTAYGNTLFITIIGTVISMLLTCTSAFVLSRRELPGRNLLTLLVVFTMLFNAGTVPFYVTCRQILGIGNSVLALFLPMSFSAYWVIIMRTFYQSNVPDSIIESARIDGAGEWRTLIQIVLPLATPGLATVALFAAIGIWNNFFNCLLLVDEAKYYNLQFTIYQTLNSIRFLKEMASQVEATWREVWNS